MNIYDVFTTPEEGEILRKCGVDFNTASFASVRNSPSCDYSIPVIIPDISKNLVSKAVVSDSEIVIPVWCLNDLMQIVIDNKWNCSLPLYDDNPNSNTKRARISSIVSFINNSMRRSNDGI